MKKQWSLWSNLNTGLIHLHPAHASACMSVFRYLHLESRYEFLLKGNNEIWREGKKVGHRDFFVKQNDGWSKISEDDIAESKFVDSPIAVLPDGGYGGMEILAELQFCGWNGRANKGVWLFIMPSVVVK